MEIILILVVIALFVFLYWLYRVAKKNEGTFGHLVRVWWNTSFKVSSWIPFFGWMANFIITDDEEEKKLYKEIGQNADNFGAEMLAESAERAKRREAEFQASLTQEEAERKKLEEDLQSMAYREIGTRDVHLNKDGSKVRVGEGEYMSVEEFKRQMR